jgi:hypothetical protein
MKSLTCSSLCASVFYTRRKSINVELENKLGSSQLKLRRRGPQAESLPGNCQPRPKWRMVAPRPHCILLQGTPICMKCERIRDATSKYLSISGEGRAGLPYGMVAQKLWIETNCIVLVVLQIAKRSRHTVCLAARFTIDVSVSRAR